MHHLLITVGAAALALALWADPGAAEASLGGLTNPGVPVVNGSGKLVGIITENDLVIPDEEGDPTTPHPTLVATGNSTPAA